MTNPNNHVQKNPKVKTSHLFGMILSTIVCLLIVNLIVSGWLVFDRLNREEKTDGVKQEITTPKAFEESYEPVSKTIQTFTNNSGLVDIGWVLSLEKKQISSGSTQNCKVDTNVLIQNGCYFGVLPYSLGIPKKGVYFKSIKVEGDLKQDSTIFVDLKSYDKGDEFTKIAEIKAYNLNTEIVLPPTIPLDQGLYFRLFAKDNEIKISKIRISYYSVENLKTVNLKTTEGRLNDYAAGSLYADINGNQTFEAESDIEWNCKPNFPGVKLVKSTDSTSINLIRDDTCFSEVLPDTWKDDVEKKLALPPGGWFLSTEDGKNKMYFEVNQTEKEQVIAHENK